MNLRLHIAALVAVLLAAAAPPATAVAQTKADAFAGKIPPVSGQLFQKAGRFEVIAGGDLSLNDAFFTKLFGGVEAGYHVTESWSLSVGAWGIPPLDSVTRSGSAVVCSSSAGCSNATETQLWQVPGRIRGLGAVGVAWAPVYGKLNVLAEQVAHFDLALLLGVDAVRRDEILSKADAERLAATGGEPKTVLTTGFHVGLGAHLFITEGVALRLLVKDVVYPVKVPNNGSGTDWQNQIFTELGFSFFFPMHNRPQR